MKIRYLCAAIAVALAANLPVVGAEDTFQMEAIPLASPAAADTSQPSVQMVSATIAAAGSVTVNPCVGGTRGCPDPSKGNVSIPFPSAVLPAGGDVVVTWMFQDLSYNGPIQFTVGFTQNNVVIGQPSQSHSNPSIVAGNAYLVHFATVVPTQAAPGPVTVVVNLDYGGTITRASQEFAASSSSAAPNVSVPGIQMVSVTIAALGSVTVNPCMGGTEGCPDPTPGYVSIPFPSAVVPIGGGGVVTWMFQDISYNGPIEITLAFVQNGAVVGQPAHFSLDDSAGFGSLGHFGSSIPQASAGPTMVVVTVSYGGNTARASQTFTLQ